jgi:hypothetical protein
MTSPRAAARHLWVRAEECVGGEHEHQAISGSSLGRARVGRLDPGSHGSGSRATTGRLDRDEVAAGVAAAGWPNGIAADLHRPPRVDLAHSVPRRRTVAAAVACGAVRPRGGHYRVATWRCAQAPGGTRTPVGRAGASLRAVGRPRVSEHHRSPCRRPSGCGLLPGVAGTAATPSSSRLALRFFVVGAGERHLARSCRGALDDGRPGRLALRKRLVARPDIHPSPVVLRAGPAADASVRR